MGGTWAILKIHDLRNHGFSIDERGLRLSPAYDMNPSVEAFNGVALPTVRPRGWLAGLGLFGSRLSMREHIYRLRTRILADRLFMQLSGRRRRRRWHNARSNDWDTLLVLGTAGGGHGCTDLSP